MTKSGLAYVNCV